MTEVPRHRVTALDVAHAAGVSRTTVSYVLNAAPSQSISEKTRERVFEAVRRLNYVPHSAARALRRGQNDSVLVVMPDWPLGRVVALLIDELGVILDQSGLSLIIARQHAGRPLVDLVRELLPAAVVALGEFDEADLDAVRGSGVFVATVVLTSSPVGETGVAIPQNMIGDIQVRHLADRGHTRIGYFGPGEPRLGVFRNPRLDGARHACVRLGLAEPDVVDGEPTVASATTAVRQWLGRGEPVTAVVAFNDDFAGSVLAGMAEENLSVPVDLAVIGVDNDPLSQFTTPGLTTVDQNHQIAASHLAQVVVNGARGAAMPSPPTADVLTLVVRGST